MEVDANLTESIGQRSGDTSSLRLAPESRVSDQGRRPMPQFGQVDVDRVLPDPSQPRVEFGSDAVERLAQSLKSAGQIAPIRVRWSEPHQKWLIVAGERRWRAALQAGLTSIECFFYEKELSDGEILQLQLVENLLRENLRPIEEARGFQRLMQLHNRTGKEVADELSVPESKVSRSLALLRLPEDVQHLVETGKIASRVAYEISKATTPAKQRRLAQQAAAGQLKLGEAAKAVRRKRRQAPSKKTRGVKLNFPAEEGWNVTVSCRRAGSYHEVEHSLLQALEEVRIRIQGGVQLF
jgi:ParB family chromosome partitioning protein